MTSNTFNLPDGFRVTFALENNVVSSEWEPAVPAHDQFPRLYGEYCHARDQFLASMIAGPIKVQISLNGEVGHA